MKIIKSCILASVLTSVAFSGSVPVQPVGEIIPVVESEQSYFMTLSGGVSSMDISTDIDAQNVVSGSVFDDSGYVGDFGIGYEFSENFFMSANLQYSKLDDVSVTNVYGTINYQFSNEKIKPFVGAIIGYSFLEWKNDPIADAVVRDTKGDSFTYGGQVGISYEATEAIELSMMVQRFEFVQDTFIDGEAFEHKNQTNFLLGVRYDF